MKPLIGLTAIFASLCNTAAAELLLWAAIASSVLIVALILARLGRSNHGKRAGKRIRDASRDRQSGENPAQSQYLGLSDRCHRDRDDDAAQPHGAGLDRLQAARAAQRLQDRSVVGTAGQEAAHPGDVGAGRLARVLRGGR